MVAQGAVDEEALDVAVGDVFSVRWRINGQETATVTLLAGPRTKATMRLW